MLWIEDGKEKWITDISNTAIDELDKKAGPALKEFFSKGFMDEELKQRVVEEMGKRKNLIMREKFLLRRFKARPAPIVIRDN